MTSTWQLPHWVQYVSALGPLFTVLGGVGAATIAAFVALRTARRSRWLAQTQWAVDRVGDDPDSPQAQIAVAALGLQSDTAKSKDEKRLLLAATSVLLERVESQPSDVEFVVDESEPE